MIVSSMTRVREALPSIDRIEPPSGQAGMAYPLRIAIHGAGFDRQDNIVWFGPVEIRGVASPDGRRIDLPVPKAMPSAGEVPPMVLAPGDYEVTVVSRAGRSRPAVFKLTR